MLEVNILNIYLIYLPKVFFLLPLAFTMNASHPQPYIFAGLSKWSIMSLAFETEMSNLSDYFCIYIVAWGLI